MTRFNCYADFADNYKKCRNAEKGRPINNWARLFKDGNDYVVKLMYYTGSSPELFRVSRSEVVTFNMPLENLLQSTQTLVSSLHRVAPFRVDRKRKGIYTIAPFYTPTSWSLATSPEYFNGIEFNIKTGECLNPRPNMMHTVIPKVRKTWLADVKRFKKGLKIRAKVGALDGFIAQVMKERETTTHWSYKHNLPNWDDSEVVKRLLRCMRAEEYTPDMLHLMVASVCMGWRTTEITRQMVLNNVDSVFDRHSIAFRKAYGVFGDTLHTKT